MAWNGVLVLMYQGFQPPFADLKARLNEPSVGLKKEAFGSKWPKTTLGAVQELLVGAPFAPGPGTR